MPTIYDHPSTTDRFHAGDQIDLGISVYAIREADYRDHAFSLNCTEMTSGEKVVMVGMHGNEGSSVTTITTWDWSRKE